MQAQIQDMSVASLTVLGCSAGHIARSGKSSGDGLPAPGDYRTGNPEGECPVFSMLEGGGGYTGSVSGFVVFSENFHV